MNLQRLKYLTAVHRGLGHNAFLCHYFCTWIFFLVWGKEWIFKKCLWWNCWSFSYILRMDWCIFNVVEVLCLLAVRNTCSAVIVLLIHVCLFHWIYASSSVGTGNSVVHVIQWNTSLKIIIFSVNYCIQCKLATLAFHHFDNTLLPYPSSLCTYQPSCSLHSLIEWLLKIPKTNLKTFGRCFFGYIALSGTHCQPSWELLLPLKFQS